MKIKNHGMHLGVDQIIGSISLIYGLVLNAVHAFQNLKPVIETRGKLRRLWLVHFQKGYVERQISLRHGECHQCGTCCNFLLACPMLTKQSFCRIYGICRPKACKVFPINQRDIDEVKLCGGKCGYWFKRKEK